MENQQQPFKQAAFLADVSRQNAVFGAKFAPVEVFFVQNVSLCEYARLKNYQRYGRGRANTAHV